MRKLLVLDDEPDFCDFVANVADGLGFQTETLTQARDFVSVYDEFQPDTVVLDMVMPDMDGFDVVRSLIEKKADVRLLIVTGYNPLYAKSAQMQSAAKGLSEVKSFTKPISVSKLRAALNG